VVGIAGDLDEGLVLAAKAIDDGSAASLLDRLAGFGADSR
jgi:anthranilate phosphoribosyltransferase